MVVLAAFTIREGRSKSRGLVVQKVERLEPAEIVSCSSREVEARARGRALVEFASRRLPFPT
jgi:hypothetical protein